MHYSCSGLARLVAGAFTLALLTTTTAVAGDRDSGASRLDTAPVGALNGSQQPPRNHATLFGHLPPVEQNLELVGRARADRFAGTDRRGQIADLAVHKGFAYLNSGTSESCTKGGTYIVDIRDPANPAEIGFLPAAAGLLPRRGRPRGLTRHACVHRRPARGQRRGLLERRDPSGDVPATAGGFDLYDVTDPANPVPLGPERRRQRRDGSLDPDAGPSSAELLPLRLRLAGRPAGLPRSASTTPSSPTSTSSTSPTRPIRS